MLFTLYIINTINNLYIFNINNKKMCNKIKTI